MYSLQLIMISSFLRLRILWTDDFCHSAIKAFLDGAGAARHRGGDWKGYLRPDQFLDHLTVIKNTLFANISWFQVVNNWCSFFRFSSYYYFYICGLTFKISNWLFPRLRHNIFIIGASLTWEQNQNFQEKLWWMFNVWQETLLFEMWNTVKN